MKRKMAALLIGNSNYSNGNGLRNPVNDARDSGKKLVGYGFTIDTAMDCSVSDMDKKLKVFSNVQKNQEVGLFFFAGHGIQIEGSNYLIALERVIYWRKHILRFEGSWPTRLG